MVVLFTITFGWIALAAAAAIAGVLFGGVRRKARSDEPIEQRTAIVMPVYNEDPARTFASLQAMGDALASAGHAGSFEIFVLSDTTSPAVYVQETAALQVLREALGDRIRVWYRRRADNVGKQGRQRARLRDALGRPLRLHDRARRGQHPVAGHARHARARDGRRSRSSGSCKPCRGSAAATPCSRACSSSRAPSMGRSLRAAWRAWQGDDGNYWGHNAIIRVRAFAAACGLPMLPGKKPFGGSIMSHDFVEAALLRRAGWAVRMLPTLGGSWEESPPSLLDVAARDRRWAQGNMQHLAVVGSAGLTWPNRMHMWIGVMSYLASPLWLAADRRRSRRDGAHRDRAVRVFHRRDLAVPALAAVRQRADDRAVHRRDGDAVHAEDSRPAARARHARAHRARRVHPARARRRSARRCSRRSTRRS